MKTISFVSGRGKITCDAKDLAAKTAMLDVKEQVSCISGVYDLGPPWEWHCHGVMHKLNDAAPACFRDVAYYQSFIDWYITTITKFEADLLTETGKGMQLRNYYDGKPTTV